MNSKELVENILKGSVTLEQTKELCVNRIADRVTDAIHKTYIEEATKVISTKVLKDAPSWKVSLHKDGSNFVVDVNSKELEEDNGEIKLVFSKEEDATLIYDELNSFKDFPDLKKDANKMGSKKKITVKGF